MFKKNVTSLGSRNGKKTNKDVGRKNHRNWERERAIVEDIENGSKGVGRTQTIGAEPKRQRKSPEVNYIYKNWF